VTAPFLARSAQAMLLVAVSAMPAQAGERRQTFEIAATIVRGCTVATDAGGRWGAIALGTVQGLRGASATGTLVSGGVAGLALSCTPGTTVNVAADTGDHAAAGQRRLMRSGGSESVPYTLYADGATTAWSLQPLAITFPAGVSTRTLPVTAAATLTAALPAGTYTDTVRVTLTF
jgi:spore coat protein U-like protein